MQCGEQQLPGGAGLCEAEATRGGACGGGQLQEAGPGREEAWPGAGGGKVCGSRGVAPSGNDVAQLPCLAGRLLPLRCARCAVRLRGGEPRPGRVDLISSAHTRETQAESWHWPLAVAQPALSAPLDRMCWQEEEEERVLVERSELAEIASSAVAETQPRVQGMQKRPGLWVGPTDPRW